MKDETLLPDVASLEKVLEWIAGLPVPTKSATANYCRLKNFIIDYNATLQSGNSEQPVTVPDESWRIEAEKQAEIYGQSFVVFRNGEQPQCADPTKVVISFTDKGLGHCSSDTALLIPDGLIAAVNRLLDSDGSRGCYDAMVRGDAREEIERLLAAAPKAPDGWIPVSERLPDNDIYVSVVSRHGEYVSGLVNGEWLDLHDCSSFPVSEIYLWLILPSLPSKSLPDAPKVKL